MAVCITFFSYIKLLWSTKSIIAVVPMVRKKTKKFQKYEKKYIDFLCHMHRWRKHPFEKNWMIKTKINFLVKLVRESPLGTYATIYYLTQRTIKSVSYFAQTCTDIPKRVTKPQPGIYPQFFTTYEADAKCLIIDI